MIERPDWLVAEGIGVVPMVMNDGGVLAPLDGEFDEGRDIEQVEVAPSLAADLDPDLVADWEKSGGYDHRLGVAKRVARELVDGFSAGEKAEFLADFDALPEAAQSVILSELTLEPDGVARPVSEQDLARFASTDEGMATVQVWRGHAVGNLSVLRTRIERILSRAEATGSVDALLRWFDELTPEVAAAIYRMLVR